MIYKKLIVDEYNDLFDTEGLEYTEFPSDYDKIRKFTLVITTQAPDCAGLY